eukprot:246022_1
MKALSLFSLAIVLSKNTVCGDHDFAPIASNAIASSNSLRASTPLNANESSHLHSRQKDGNDISVALREFNAVDHIINCNLPSTANPSTAAGSMESNYGFDEARVEMGGEKAQVPQSEDNNEDYPFDFAQPPPIFDANAFGLETHTNPTGLWCHSERHGTPDALCQVNAVLLMITLRRKRKKRKRKRRKMRKNRKYTSTMASNTNTIILSHLTKVLLLLSFYQQTTRAQIGRTPPSNYTDHNFICNASSYATNPCTPNAAIFCPSDANCNVSCDEYESCKDAIIHCPSNGACHVSCDNKYACMNAEIRWVDNEPNSLYCGVYRYSCLLINSIKPFNQTEDFSQNCSAYRNCQEATFHCPSNANCSILCDAQQSCKWSVIHCPTNTGSCFITCDGSQSCDQATIYCPPNALCQVECSAGGCVDMNVEWSDIPDIGRIICPNYDCYELPRSLPPRSSLLAASNTADYTLSCDSEFECSRSIFCPTDADCNVSCNAYKSCYGSTIYCPANEGVCNITCSDSSMSCYSSTIYAQNASFFNFAVIQRSGNSNGQIAPIRNIKIWFPPKAKNVPRARLYFDTNSTEVGLNQKYYAINGWQDIDVHISRYDYSQHNGSNGTMYCNTGYIDSCAFAADSFACSASNPICARGPIISTAAPSFDPSSAPTSTLISTLYPSSTPNSTSIIHQITTDNDETVESTTPRSIEAQVYETSSTAVDLEADVTDIEDVSGLSLSSVIVSCLSFVCLIICIVALRRLCTKRRAAHQNQDIMSKVASNTVVAGSGCNAVVLVTPSLPNNITPKNADEDEIEDADDDDESADAEELYVDCVTSTAATTATAGENNTNDGDEYKAIKAMLEACDAVLWKKYFINFEKEKINDSRLKFIAKKQDDDPIWDKLIPEWGVKMEFIAMLAERKEGGHY